MLNKLYDLRISHLTVPLFLSRGLSERVHNRKTVAIVRTFCRRWVY